MFLGYGGKSEWCGSYECDSRLKAAICNFGFAERFLIDNYPKSAKEIGIISDSDGQDVRYSGEHNVLYSLLMPHSDYESRKLSGLYKEYERFLFRAKDLVRLGNIKIGLADRDFDIEKYYRRGKNNEIQ